MTSERKLHPAAALAGGLEALRDALLPVVATVLISGGGPGTGVAFALLGVVGSAVAGYARWSNTSYWISDGALHFRSGVFSPDERMVPIARITAFDEVRGPAQRLFGVAALHVQTAGGAAHGEIVLTAVTADAAEELRAAAGSPAEPTAAPAEPTATWRLGFGPLVVAALTGPQLGVIVPLAGGAAALAFQSLNAHEGRALLDRLPDAAAGWEHLAVVVAAGVLVLALGGAIVGFGGFVAERTADRLRLHRGYVQRRVASIDAGRIHAVRIVEGALRRPLGLCSVRLEVAGYAKEPAAGQTLVPLCRRRDADAILRRLVPELGMPANAARRPPRRALSKFLFVPTAAGIVVAAAVFDGTGSPFAAAAMVVGAAVGLARYRAAGWWITETTVAARSRRLLARTTTVALSARLQDTELAESLTERRSRLGTVRFAVASKHRARVQHIGIAEAGGLFEALRERMAQRNLH